MRMALTATLLLALFCVGCITTMKGDGEVGFRVGTDLAVYQRTEAEGTRDEIDLLPWARDFLKSDDEHETTDKENGAIDTAEHSGGADPDGDGFRDDSSSD